MQRFAWQGIKYHTSAGSGYNLCLPGNDLSHQGGFHSCLLHYCYLFCLRLHETTTCPTCHKPLSLTPWGHQRFLNPRLARLPCYGLSFLVLSSWCLHSISPFPPEALLPGLSRRRAPLSPFLQVLLLCLLHFHLFYFPLPFSPDGPPGVGSLLCLFSSTDLKSSKRTLPQ